MNRRVVLAAAALVPLQPRAQTVDTLQKSEAAMVASGDEFRPGDKVPASGIYTVTHDKLDGDDHAPPHQVIATAGTVFPQCRGCGDWVTFRHQKPPEPIEENEHFRRS